MKKSPLIGISIAVACVIVLVSFANVVGVQTVESSNHTLVRGDSKSIVLAFQLINKLRNYPDIQNVETEDEILQIIEGDEELNSIVEKLKSFDCGCEGDYKPELERRRWWIVCIFLFPIWLISVLITIGTAQPFLENIVYAISEIFNCGF